MISTVITIICVVYMIFSFTPMAEDVIDHWLLLILRSICVIIESALIYNDLYIKYRMVIYDDSDYEPTNYQIILQMILYILLYIIIVIILFLSILFMINANNPAGTLLFQAISILILIAIVVLYMRNGFSDFSGDAFCDALDKHNNEKTERSFLPFSLNKKEMQLYEDSFCVVKHI